MAVGDTIAGYVCYGDAWVAANGHTLVTLFAVVPTTAVALPALLIVAHAVLARARPTRAAFKALDDGQKVVSDMEGRERRLRLGGVIGTGGNCRAPEQHSRRPLVAAAGWACQPLA